MQTDADTMPGVERLAISTPRPDMGLSSGVKISAAAIDAGLGALVPPHGVFMVKGWSRVLSMLTIAACAFENEPFRQARFCLLRKLNIKAQQADANSNFQNLRCDFNP